MEGEDGIEWHRGAVSQQHRVSSQRKICGLHGAAVLSYAAYTGPQGAAGGVLPLIGIGILLGDYLFAWVSVGRDPAPGTVIPRFTPPRGYSPAALRADAER
jgi:hypothetical protein